MRYEERYCHLKINLEEHNQGVKLKMLKWEKLLSPVRLKKLDNGEPSTSDTRLTRLEAERDYDRILFAAPTRRLADKTQVFPMEKNDSVRNRLTHSHEVSNLARSIGVKIAYDHTQEVFGESAEALQVTRIVPSMLAAAGLAHDLGNPPFGHQGEAAIQQWFFDKFESEDIENDFTEFDGNAHTFRLLTKLQILNDNYGLDLTAGTLAALIKYPTVFGSESKAGFKKHGVFRSERKTIEIVWQQTGLAQGQRHPLAYIMEACDDIAYSIIDAEDTVKKGYASFYDLMDHLRSFESDFAINKVLKYAESKNNEYKKLDLSSSELNDISMQMFRVKAISVMIDAATHSFVENIQRMLKQEIDPGFELIKQSSAKLLCKQVKKFDRKHGFQNREVLKLELEGANYIKTTMDLLWKAIEFESDSSCPFERFVFNDISENYRRVYEGSDKKDYNKKQLLCDALSGMTEKFLIEKHDELLLLKPNEIS